MSDEKYCINCRHYNHMPSKHYCVRPTGGRSLVTGDLTRLWGDCMREREPIDPISDDGRCGPEGRYWEAAT